MPLLSAEPIPLLSYVSSPDVQPAFCGDESLSVVDRLVLSTLNLRVRKTPFKVETSICASVCAERRLDGLHRLEGRLLASSNTSGQSHISQFCHFESSFSIQSSLFRSLYGSAVFHMGHGSGLSHSAFPGYSHIQLPGRLVHPGSVSLSGSPGSGVRSSIFVRISVSSSPGRHPISFHRSEWFIWVLLWIPLFFRTSPSQPRIEKLRLIADEFLSCFTQPVSLW